MNGDKHLDVLIENVCRIIYSISDFPTIADILNKEDRKDSLINLIKQACQYILYAFAFGISLFSIYILLLLVCVLDNKCYYFYGGV